MSEGDADDDGQADHRLDHAAEHVTGQDRGPGDGHRAEPGDDAFRHVHGDRDRASPGRRRPTAIRRIPGVR